METTSNGGRDSGEEPGFNFKLAATTPDFQPQAGDSHAEPPDAAPSPETFETCPVCAQRTAPHLFRRVRDKKLCLLCAQRADDAEASLEAQALDRRHHGSAGWLWKHMARVGVLAIIGLLVRQGFLHWLAQQR